MILFLILSYMICFFYFMILYPSVFPGNGGPHKQEFDDAGNYAPPPLNSSGIELIKNSPGITNLIRATSYPGKKYISLALTPTEAMTSRYFIGGIRYVISIRICTYIFNRAMGRIPGLCVSHIGRDINYYYRLV